MLLAVQTSIIALASADSAGAATGPDISGQAGAVVPASVPFQLHDVFGFHRLGLPERTYLKREENAGRAGPAHGRVVLRTYTPALALAPAAAQAAHSAQARLTGKASARTRTEGRAKAAARTHASARTHAAVLLGHHEAMGRLRAAGLRWKSTGDCTDRRISTCTSLTAVRTGTVERAIELKRDSHCPIIVTGGTEAGHAPGAYSHGNGYKLDITDNRCVTRYITGTFQPYGVRGDGAPLYRAPNGDIYAHESDHWDIQFR